MEPVRSHRSKLVVDAARLHRGRIRRQRNQTLIEGPHLVEEAVKAGVTFSEVFVHHDDAEGADLARRWSLEPLWVDDAALRRLAATESPRGPVAVIQIPQPRLEANRDLLVSWGVSDPGNAGSLIRIAWAFGWGYAYTQSSADPWSPKAVRAGAGGQFHVPLARIEGLGELRAWTTVATAVKGGEELARPGAGPVAVLVGEEAAGLPEEVVAAADVLVTIPMPGNAESLNAAVAAGIVVHRLAKGGEVGEGGV